MLSDKLEHHLLKPCTGLLKTENKALCIIPDNLHYAY